VGTALALPIVTAVIAGFGWRASFVVTGALGFVWVVFWILLYRTPHNHPRVSREEIEYIEAGGARTMDTGEVRQDPEASEGIKWRDLCRYRTIWGMMLGFFCLNFVIYFFITWFPDYLVSARGFNLLQLGSVGTIPPVVAIFGGLLGGFTSDTLVKRGVSLTVARKTCLVGGLLFSSGIALAALVPSAVGALALLSVSYASLTFAAASVWSLPADVAPASGEGAANWVGSIGGIQNFASNLAGIASPTVVGFLVGATGTYVTGLVTAGVLSIVGAVSYLVIVGRVEPLPALAQTSQPDVS
jgi:MFS transporter, ACS family, D-galactonate transporter